MAWCLIKHRDNFTFTLFSAAKNQCTSVLRYRPNMTLRHQGWPLTVCSTSEKENRSVLQGLWTQPLWRKNTAETKICFTFSKYRVHHWRVYNFPNVGHFTHKTLAIVADLREIFWFFYSTSEFGIIWLTRVYPKVSGLAACSENCKW
jgi:hypothetical protein